MAPTKVAPSDGDTKRTLYERTLDAQQNDSQWHKEVTMGTRIGFYTFKSEIGNGNFSHVRLAFHQLTKERVAIKILDKMRLDEKSAAMLDREISVMEGLQHPNTIRLFEVVETLTRIHLVMEYAPGGELFAKITTHGKFPEPEAKHVFAQLVSAVHYLHARNIVHRDLKAENVFFSSSTTVKVGDFGFSTWIRTSDHLLDTFCGSPPYAAPELFKDQSYRGPPVDVWALGILLYFLITATMPFCAQTVASLKKLILFGHFSIPSFVSEPVSHLMRKLLEQSPQDRITLTQVINCDWLAGERALRDQFRPMPSVDDKVKCQLERIGIDRRLLAESLPVGHRNAVVGTYYILLHKCQNETNREESDNRFPPWMSIVPKEMPVDKKERRRKFRWSALKLQNLLIGWKRDCDSKVCTIL